MSAVMGNELFVDFSRSLVQVKGPDSYTRPVALDLRRAVYVSSDSDLEKEMQSVSTALSVRWPKVLLAIQS